MQRIKVAVIGSTGRGNYGHGLDVAWKAVPECQVVAVADDNDAGRKTAQKRIGAPRAYADYREMLDRERPTIVAVAPRWLDRHRDMALACAEFGCHMYMEKPFCRTLDEADEIVRACEMRHVKLALAHISRYSPVLAVVKKLIAAGEIGDLLEIRTRGKEDQRGGAEDLWVLGSHVLDLMDAVAGSPTSCFATLLQDGRPIEKKDVRSGSEGLGPLAGNRVDAQFRFPSGLVGSFSSRAKAGGNPSRFGMRLFGAKGVIDVPMGYGLPAYLLKDPGWASAGSSAKWQTVTSQGVDKPAPVPSGSGYDAGNPAVIRDLLDAIRTDRAPLCGLAEARSVLEMILACFESHRMKRPVDLPLVNRKHPLTML